MNSCQDMSVIVTSALSSPAFEPLRNNLHNAMGNIPCDQNSQGPSVKVGGGRVAKTLQYLQVVAAAWAIFVAIKALLRLQYATMATADACDLDTSLVGLILGQLTGDHGYCRDQTQILEQTMGHAAEAYAHASKVAGGAAAAFLAQAANAELRREYAAAAIGDDGRRGRVPAIEGQESDAAAVGDGGRRDRLLAIEDGIGDEGGYGSGEEDGEPTTRFGFMERRGGKKRRKSRKRKSNRKTSHKKRGKRTRRRR